MVTDISNIIPNIVQQEIIKQSPEIGIDIRSFGGKWQEQQ